MSADHGPAPASPEKDGGKDAVPSGAYESLVAPWAALTGYDRFDFERRRVAWMRSLLPEPGFPRILNFGCGTATVTPWLCAAFQPRVVTGLDVSREHLAVAAASRHEPGVDFRHIDEHVPAGDADLVYCNGVFHHIPPGERQASMDYVFRCLRPGGVFALWENNPFNPVMRAAMAVAAIDHDAVPIRPAQARRLLEGAGFEIVSLTYAFFFPRLLGFLRGVEPALKRLPLGAQYLVLARKA